MNTPPVRITLIAAAAIWLAGFEALRAQTATWVENTPASSPPFAHHDMTYDSARGRMILAGRTSIMSSSLGVYAGAPDGSWTRLPNPSPAVPGRHDIELAYPRHTWAWDGTDWKKLAPLRSPPATIDYAFAYFPERNALVLHGGWNDPNWQFRKNVWLLTIDSDIRFTGLELNTTDISLTSTGRVQTGARQILQTSTNLAALAAWVNTQTNLAPTATNTWLVPRLAGQEFFRILEQP